MAGATDLPLLWDTVVQLVEETIPLHTAFLWYDYFDFASTSQSTLVLETPSRERGPEYWQARRRCHPTPRFLKDHPRIRLHRVSDTMAPDELRGSEFYRRFMEPEGWEYGITLSFWQGQQIQANIVLYRTLLQGDFSPEEEAWLALLHPVIEANLLRLIEQDRRQAEQSRIEGFVRRLPIGLILLNWDFQPVFVNEEGFRQAFHWIHGTERSADLHPRENFLVPRQLRRLCKDYREVWIERFGSGQAETNVHVERVIHPRNPELYAIVSAQSERGSSSRRPNFLIRFGGLESRTLAAFTPSKRQLQILEQLTPTERQICLMISQGLTNRKIADKMGREVSTIKTHIIHIYAKLGIHTRARLANLLS